MGATIRSDWFKPEYVLTKPLGAPIDQADWEHRTSVHGSTATEVVNANDDTNILYVREFLQSQTPLLLDLHLIGAPREHEEASQYGLVPYVLRTVVHKADGTGRLGFVLPFHPTFLPRAFAWDFRLRGLHHWDAAITSLGPKGTRHAEIRRFLDAHAVRFGKDHIADLVERQLTTEDPIRPEDPSVSMYHGSSEVLPDRLLVVVRKWLAASRPSRLTEGLTFEGIFGDRLPVILQAMLDAGILPREGRGKRRVIAVFHAAFDHYGLKVPPDPRWPEMLGHQFPEVTWSEKNRPLLSVREREAAKDYRSAYLVTLDLLQ